MFRIILAVIVFAVTSLPGRGSAGTTAADVTGALSPHLTHPYVYFTDQEKQEILDRIGQDPAYRDVYRRKLAEANRLLHTPVDYDAPPRSPRARFDGTYDLERYNYTNTNNAYDLAFIYQMTGDIRYAEKAFEFADAVCDQPTWVHGAHWFPIIYDRIWPWGADDDQVVFAYAQATDHIVFKMAAVYDWLYPALEKQKRDRIRGALLEKAILPVRGNYEYYWWATAYRCNWCSVCHGSLGVAAIALLTEDPGLTDVIAASFTHIGRNLDEIRGGGWQEGIGYLNYTLRTSAEFGDVLKRVTGGRLNLFEHPKYAAGIETLVYCHILPDKSVHFGDSSGGKINSWWLYTMLANQTGNREAVWLRDNLTSGAPSGVADLFMPRNTLEPALPIQPSVHFPDVGWVILRSDFNNPDNIVIAAKSGPHDDPHHGHLDSGHLSLYWRGTEFIKDHGSAGYDREYFDDARWEKYPLAVNAGHNTVIVNGEPQLPGKRKNQPWNFDIGGTVATFVPGSGREYTVLDPTDAHAKVSLKRWRRHIVLDKPRVTVVLDEIAAVPGSGIAVRFHPAGTYTVRDGWTEITDAGNSVAVIPLTIGGHTIKTGRHAILAAQKNASFRWVPYFDTSIRAGNGTTLAATVIVPLVDGVSGGEVARSATLTTDGRRCTVSFDYDGGRHTFEFAPGPDGLELAD